MCFGPWQLSLIASNQSNSRVNGEYMVIVPHTNTRPFNSVRGERWTPLCSDSEEAPSSFAAKRRYTNTCVHVVVQPVQSAFREHELELTSYLLAYRQSRVVKVPTLHA